MKTISISVIVSIALFTMGAKALDNSINMGMIDSFSFDTMMSQDDFIGDDGLEDREFNCKVGEIRTVQHYGVEDLFSTSNGEELAHPNSTTAQLPSLVEYNNRVHAGFANYDNPLYNRLFLEDIHNLPTNITSGRFYIGLKSNGSSLQYNDALTIGDLTTSDDRYTQYLTELSSDSWSHQVASLGDIYWNDFANIDLNGGTTLLEYLENHNRFDAYVQDDTSVDFIDVVTCSKPNPIEEITEVVNKFECSEREQLVQILGGTIDAFSPILDIPPANPSSNLISQAGQIIGYDSTIYDHHFLETLNLPTATTITKAELNIGYKPLGTSLYINDTLKVGDYGTNYANGHLYYGSWNNYILTQGWNINSISNGEKVAQANLADINNTTGTGSVFDTMLNKGYIDIFVEDDTAVDFVQLNLCVRESCTEDEVSIDLSQLENWTNRPSDAVENNVFNGTQYQGIWDDTLNWFQFPNSHTDEVLEIPFCACGDTKVNIASLKADNNATINIDNTLVVSQQGYDQQAMKRDDMGGNHVDGNQTILGIGVGVDHILRLNVHNRGSYFGVAMDGTLNFQGHLGSCSDSIEPELNDDFIGM